MSHAETDDFAQDETRELIEALIDDRLSAADGKRLERLVCQSKSARQLYVLSMHLHSSIATYAAAERLRVGGQRMRLDNAANETPSIDSNDPLMLLSAAKNGLLVPRPSTANPRRGLSRKSTFKIAAWISTGLAACLFLAIFLRTRPVAQITATAGAEWADADAPSTGSELRRGRVLTLRQGGAEIVFASGAHAILEGPAVFTIVDRNSAFLTSGKVSAHVPPEARGFKITSGKVVVTDFGTEFGLSVDPNGEASIDVFSGKVDVSHLIDAGTEVKTTHLVQGQAMAGSASTGTMKPAKADTQTFAREIAQVRRQVPLHNTGAGIGPYQSDPYWQIIAESISPNFKPQNAVMIPVKRNYAANSRESAWVSLANNDLPDGTFTFESSIDLTDFDAKTLSLTARIMADDGIGDVLINGKGCGVHFIDQAGKVRFFEFPITGDFVSGPNKVDVIVINQRGHYHHMKSPMLLRLEWVATARPVVVAAQPAK